MLDSPYYTMYVVVMDTTQKGNQGEADEQIWPYVVVCAPLAFNKR